MEEVGYEDLFLEASWASAGPQPQLGHKVPALRRLLHGSPEASSPRRSSSGAAGFAPGMSVRERFSAKKPTNSAQNNNG
jgi:hypothetical protein